MRNMAKEGLFAGRRLFSVWELLIKHYKGATEHKLKDIGDLIDPTEPNPPSRPSKSGSEAKKDISEILDFFFNFCAKGRESEYTLSFAPESPRLILEKRAPSHSKTFIKEKSENNISSKDGSPEEVIYSENIHCRIKYNRSIYTILLLALLPLVTVLLLWIIPGYYEYYLTLTKKNWQFSIIASVAVILEMLIYFIWRALIRLPKDNFTYLVGKYFLKRDIDKLVTYLFISSYGGRCAAPGCRGRLYLANEFVNSLGYIGKCKDHGNEHWFSFDPASLRGSRIKMGQ